MKQKQYLHHITIPEDLTDLLRKEAKKEERSVNGQVRYIVKKYLQQQKEHEE